MRIIVRLRHRWESWPQDPRGYDHGDRAIRALEREGIEREIRRASVQELRRQARVWVARQQAIGLQDWGQE